MNWVLDGSELTAASLLDGVTYRIWHDGANWVVLDSVYSGTLNECMLWCEQAEYRRVVDKCRSAAYRGLVQDVEV